MWGLGRPISAYYGGEEPSGEELIFYCDCNNNVIDRVSGLDLWIDIRNSGVVYTPQYTVDPVDSRRYCIKARSGGVSGLSNGQGISPVTIGNYSQRSTTDGLFVIANSTASGFSDESIRFWLASPTYGNHKVEFYWYCSSTASDGCIFDSTGLGNNNPNSNNSGIALDCINGNIVIRARNNSSANLDTIVGTRSSLAGNWYKVEFYFYYVSSSSYMATVNVYNTGGTLISTVTRTLNLPLQSTKFERGAFLFLSDSASNGAWAKNYYDCIKEVKVYKLPSE